MIGIKSLSHSELCKIARAIGMKQNSHPLPQPSFSAFSGNSSIGALACIVRYHSDPLCPCPYGGAAVDPALEGALGSSTIGI
jgi:hypothetical protein